MSNKLFAVGDIHGCLRPLEAVLAAADPGRNDTVVFLGDYIDRGRNSCAVIKFLAALKNRTNTIFLLGNHEEMMLASRHDADIFKSWLRYGGAATLESYGLPLLQGSLNEVPDAHWRFLSECTDYFETERHLFFHATPHSGGSLSELSAQELRWTWFDKPQPHDSGKILICGHTPQRSGVIASLGHAICIDTHVCGGGWLTCLEVNSHDFWQADNLGDVRQGNICTLQALRIEH